MDKLDVEEMSVDKMVGCHLKILYERYCDQPLSETTMQIRTVYWDKWWYENGCKNIQHNGTQHNVSLQNDNHYNGTQHKLQSA